MHLTTPTLTASWSSIAIFTFASYAAVLIVGKTDSFLPQMESLILQELYILRDANLMQNANRYKFSNPNKIKFVKAVLEIELLDFFTEGVNFILRYLIFRC